MTTPETSLQKGALGGFLLAALLILILRKPEALFAAQLWAEDGPIFLKQEHDFGPAAMFIPYAGYLCMLQRLVAFAAGFAPLLWIPTVYAWASFFIFAGVCAVILFSSRLSISDLSRMAWVATLVLVPHSGEVYLNLTNAPWITITLLIVFLLSRPALTRNQWIADALLLALLGLTGPCLILLFPLLLWKSFHTRQHRSANLWLPLIALGTCLIQAELIAQSGRTALPSVNTDIFEWLKLAIHFSGGLFLGVERPERFGFWVALVLSLVPMALTLWLFFSQKRERSHFHVAAWMLPAAGALVFGGAVMSVRDLPSALRFFNGGRYFYVPYVTLIWCYLLFVFEKESRFSQRAVAAFLLALVAYSTSTHFHAKKQGRFEFARYVESYEQGQAVSFVVPPSAEWKVDLDPHEQWRGRFKWF
jgi:hypothetical protein